MGLSQNALAVLRARCLRQDGDTGELSETPEEMFRQVARAVARAEESFCGDAGDWGDQYLEAVTSLDVLPNTPGQSHLMLLA